jgi:hypothetical protein
VNSDAESIRGTTTPLIPDLRGIPLWQLAHRTNDADDIVADLVGRCLGVAQSPSHVPVLTFNSAI